MKKYKVHFSLWNSVGSSQPEIGRLQGYLKGLTAILAGSAWYATTPINALFVGIGGFVFDFILSCIYLEEIC